MVEQRRIVVGHDFSTQSTHAFEEAIRQAESVNAEIVLVHALLASSVYPAGLEGGAVAPADPAFDEGTARKKLDVLKAKAGQKGLKVQAVLRDGARPEYVLIDVAREQDAAMIVVGTHGRSGIGRFLMGSVAEGVLRHSARPVLVVPPPDKDETKGRGLLTPEQRSVMGRPRL